MFSFCGFGTLGVVHSSERDADFVAEATSHPSGAGFSRSWSADVDSRLGAQVTANFQFTPEFYVRVGRIPAELSGRRLSKGGIRESVGAPAHRGLQPRSRHDERRRGRELSARRGRVREHAAAHDASVRVVLTP
jgi:hypothetical protein